MGRRARRVPLDFDWPLNKVWAGYLMPDELDEIKCPDCCASGVTDAFGWVMAVAYVISGLADDAVEEARGRHMHPYLTPLRQISYNHSTGRPGPQFAEFADGIADGCGGPSPFGRDVHRTTHALIKAAGLPVGWGECPTCHGHGSTEAYEGQRADQAAWEPTDPPAGDGWQMWETTSEGSPITPVLPTAEALANHCATSGTSLFGGHTATVAEWLRIITGEDFAHVQIAPGVVIM